MVRGWVDGCGWDAGEWDAKVGTQPYLPFGANIGGLVWEYYHNGLVFY